MSIHFNVQGDSSGVEHIIFQLLTTPPAQERTASEPSKSKLHLLHNKWARLKVSRPLARHMKTVAAPDAVATQKETAKRTRHKNLVRRLALVGQLLDCYSDCKVDKQDKEEQGQKT